MKFVFSFVVFLWSMVATATTIHQVVVFGDSLSDNGNLYEYMNHQLPVSPPYYKGRFTNGPVWIELMMEDLYASDAVLHYKDYAYGGAGVTTDDEDGFFSLQKQIKTYFSENQDKADSDALYVVWLGANNYFNLPDNANEVVDQVISGLYKNIEVLVAHGAKEILVLNVPDLSKTPAAIEFEAEDDLRLMSLEHNKRLKTMLTRLRLVYPEIHFIEYDVTTMMNEIINSPGSHGFIDASSTCYEHLDEPNRALKVKNSLFLTTLSSKPYSAHDSCEGYLFFDLYHPTEHAHRILADGILKMLQQESLIFE